MPRTACNAVRITSNKKKQMAGEYKKYISKEYPTIKMALTSVPMYGVIKREDLTEELLDILLLSKGEKDADKYIDMLKNNVCIPIEEVTPDNKVWRADGELFFTS